MNASMEETAAHLLCLLQRSELSDSDQNQIRKLAQELNGQWEFFFDLAEQNSAFILTEKRLSELQIVTEPKSRREGFQKKSAFYEAQSLERAEQIGKILRRAESVSIPAILLKGALLGPVIYKNQAYKKMNDVDLLFHFEDAKRFAEILKEEGYVSIGKLFGDEEFSDANYHCPPFISPDLKCLVGIHWGLSSPHSRWKVDLESIWKNKVEVSVYGARAFRMSWEENLLHLCTHLPFFKVGCRELADIYNVALFANPAIDWSRFSNRVTAWQAEDATFRVLTLARTLIEFPVPEALLAKWKSASTPFSLQDTKKRSVLQHRLISTRSTQIAKIEKAFALFRVSENYFEKVAAWAMTWKFTFWPKSNELPRLLGEVSNLSGAGAFRARCLAFTYCWRAMARDHGNIALIFITLQNIGIVIKETLLFPFRTRKAPIRLHPTFKLMEMLE